MLVTNPDVGHSGEPAPFARKSATSTGSSTRPGNSVSASFPSSAMPCTETFARVGIVSRRPKVNAEKIRPSRIVTVRSTGRIVSLCPGAGTAAITARSPRPEIGCSSCAAMSLGNCRRTAAGTASSSARFGF